MRPAGAGEGGYMRKNEAMKCRQDGSGRQRHIHVDIPHDRRISGSEFPRRGDPDQRGKKKRHEEKKVGLPKI